LPRLFISHSSKDNVEALAFQRWLVANGWSEEDVFIDLHGIGAGERWRDTLRKANASCEAVVLLATPDSLSSSECQREMNLAEDLGKEIIVAVLKGLTKDDDRIARFADRQFVDLSAQPTERMEPFEHDGRVHRVEFHLPALASIKARLAHLGIAPSSFAWTPKEGAGPYPGLAAFGEDDAGIFFGREADIMAGITKLRLLRKRRAPRLLVIQAASGAGKSSFLRAGLWPRLSRDPDFVPLAVLRPALGIMTGPDGLGRRLAGWFESQGKTKVPGDIHALLAKTDSEAAAGLAALIAEATALATTARRAGAPDARPPAPLIAIDQGEEMFASENLGESQRFLALLAGILKEPPLDVDPYVLVTIRADSVETLLQRWPALGLDTPESHYLPPLSPTAYRDVIVKPAEVYSQNVRRLSVEPALVYQLVKDATGADALPLLAFTLENLFYEFGGDGNLTLERYEAMGGIGGSIDRALADAQRKAGASGTAEHLRRLMVPGLATWDPQAGAAKRLVAGEADLVGGRGASLATLCNALVAGRLLTRGAGTLEVAHEALLRRAPIAGWLEEEKDALKLRDDVLREAREWAEGGKDAEHLVRRGARLESALDLRDNADFAAALAPAKDYITASRRLEAAGRRKARWLQAVIYTMLLGIIAGLVAFINQEFLKERYQWRVVMGPSLLTVEQEKEKAAKPGSDFKECANGCPTMIVVPAGKFTMGSPETERDRLKNEGPQHEVTIAKPFAVGRTDVTFAEWDICVAAGACTKVPDNGWGRGDRPVVMVSWEEAKGYVAWLKRMTGKDYRLLSEAEWEYSARAGNQGRWSFGDDEAQLGDYGWFFENSKGNPQPVAKKKPNAFGLYDMHGNVWQWVDDPYHENYEGALSDGSVWGSGGDASRRVIRGGSWAYIPVGLRSAYRRTGPTDKRDFNLGFRVGRTLTP
jgi:formylglycine-generating enzyme required for sulfatase activity